MIVKATLELIDEVGQDGFTLRRLAERLGVYPTAIYWHVPGRDELLSRAVALALRDVMPQRRKGPWRDHLTTILERFRKAIRRHPNIAPLVGAQLVSNSSPDFEFIEGLLAVLGEAGISGVHLTGAYNFVVASIVGFTTQEFAPLPAEDTKAWQVRVRGRLSEVDPRRFPVLARNIDALANHAFILRWQNGNEVPMGVSFEFLVAGVIAGVERLALMTKRPST
jgi:AcrR family transcriptional regulator